MGVRHADGLATLVRIPYPYNAWYEVHTFPYGVVPYDLDISPDGRLLSASMAEVNGDQFLRVWELDDVLRRRPEAARRVPLRPVGARELRLLARRPLPLRQQLLHGRVEHLPLRGRDRRTSRRCRMPRPASSGRCRWPTAGSSCSTTRPKDSFRRSSSRSRIEDVSAIKFLGAELVAKYPVVKTWQVAPPSAVDEEKLITRARAVHALAKLALANAFPVCRATRTRPGSAITSTSTIRCCFANLGVTAAYTPDRQAVSGDERGHVEVTGRYPVLAGQPVVEPLGFLRPLRSDEAQPQGLRRQDRLRRLPDLRRAAQADAGLRPRVLRQDRHAAERAERRHARSRGCSTAQVGLALHRRAPLARRCRRREGHRLGHRRQGEPASTTSTPTQVRGGFDYGFPLPLPPLVALAAQRRQASASGDRDNPVANFYFGGFGNNYVDSGVGQALPRVRFDAGLRDRRDQRR